MALEERAYLALNQMVRSLGGSRAGGVVRFAAERLLHEEQDRPDAQFLLKVTQRLMKPRFNLHLDDFHNPLLRGGRNF